MSKKIKSIIKLLFLVMLFFLGLFFCFDSAAAVSEKTGEADDHNQKMIEVYQNRIISTQTEILELKENLDWLNLKIKRIIYSNRSVSQSLYNSVQYKTAKINALEKERAYCLKQLSEFQKPEEPNMTRDKISVKDISSQDFIKKLQGKIENANLSGWIIVEQDRDIHSYRLKTVLPILFSSGSALVFKDYDEFLKNLASVIKDLDAQIIVDGYADVDPIHTNKYPSNFELGAIRAANVVHCLVGHGVNPSIFKIASTGKYRFLPLKMSANKTLERFVNITVFISA